MKASFYAGATGLMAQQQAMDAIGNNLANANTNGYQSQATAFQQLLNTEMYVNAPNSPLTGYGVQAQSAGIRVGQHALRPTGNPLDFAVMGDGFFAVQVGNETQYTRDGAFSINPEGNLITQDGAYILDDSGGHVQMEKKKSAGKDDKAETVEFDYAAAAEKIGIYRFPNAGALRPVSGNRYAETANSGKAVQIQDDVSRILSGTLETSGTSLVDEMTDMIAAQRVYQLSARVVQTADENEQIINNLRK